MDRVFFSFGPITVYWYSVLIITAIIIGIYFSSRVADKNGITKDYLTDLIFYLIPIGIIGARIYYVIFNFSIFKDNVLDIFKIWEGGLAIYGAVIASIIFIVVYSKKKNKDLLLTIDTLVLSGTITTFSKLKSLKVPNFIIEGMYIDGHYYMPTFYFESIWCLIGFIMLLIIRKKDNFRHKGLLLFVYFIWYGIGRFFIEGLRTDSLYLE